MNRITKRVLALLLCAALICGFAVMPQAHAQQPQAAGETAAPASDGHVIYGKAGETTFVPAGYTYVYEGPNGQQLTHEAQQDTYASTRVLTAQEAEALAKLQYGEGHMVNSDGQSLVCKEFDAQEAAAYSEAVQAILAGVELKDEDKVTVLCEAYTSQTPVRTLITFEEEPVIRLEGMSVALGSDLGQAELQAARKIEARQLTTLERAEKALGYEIPLHGQFSLLTNAVAATVNYGDLAAISKLEGIKSAVLMPSYAVPEVELGSISEQIVLEPNMKFVGPGMGANQAWDVGYKGEGMSVAIIDTGISLTNPAFTTQPTDPDAVAYTRQDIAAILDSKELNAERLSADTALDTVYYSAKIPFGFDYADAVANYGDDTAWNGHGSHVAGIVAGNLPEGFGEDTQMDSMGIAPEAQLIVMKVFDSTGYGYLDYILAALEDAIILGVDCANLSLGIPSGPTYFEDVTEVYDAAYEAGINVVVSAGNDAHTGVNSFWGDDLVKSDSVSTGAVGMPGTFDSVLTVASAENAQKFNTMGNTISWYDRLIGIRTMLNYWELLEVPQDMGFNQRLKGQSFAVTDDPGDAEGKLLFLTSPGGNVDALIAQAAEAGAAGLVLTVPQPSEETGWMPVEISATRFDVPACATETLYSATQLSEGDVVRVDDVWNPTDTAGEMSSFSSWGPTEGLTLKPEITGIGGNVFSAYYGDYFAISSGTSMSSPAVAASAALLRQYLRENELVAEEDLAYVVNCLLMSTATPVFDEEHGTYYFVRRQGAGMANIGAAISSGAYITVDGTNKAKLELGDDPEKTGVYEMTFNVVNFSDEDKIYTLDVSALSQKADGGQIKYGKVTYLTYDYARELDCVVTSSLEGDTVTVPAGTAAEVTVTLELTQKQRDYYDERFPAGAYVEGFIRLLSDETSNLTVPFLGFYGDFDAAPILETGSYATLLGDDYSYSTADQVHSALWSYKTIYDNELLKFCVTKHYLGDTFDENFSMVPEEDWGLALTLGYGVVTFHPELAGISPNGDGNLDQLQLGLGLRRNVENIHYTVTNRETGEILWEQDTGYMQKSFNRGVYAGPELSLEWLYPMVDVYGELKPDTSRCLLENNTWVEIRADVTLEGKEEATESITFPLYIDTKSTTGGKENITFGKVEFSPMPGIIPPVSSFELALNKYEHWFVDHTAVGSLLWNEEFQGWEGGLTTFTYGNNKEPAGGSEGRTYISLNPLSDFIMFGFTYDYAGNVDAVEIHSTDLLDYVDLTTETTRLQAGDTLTITDVGQTNFTKLLDWSVSDPTIAEIVESSNETVTIRGLSHGTVTVYGGFGDTVEGIEIQVIDPAFEALRTKFVDVPGHWAEEEILEAVYRGLFKGMDDTHFAPNANLTRAELVTVLYRMAGEPSVEGMTHPFADVAADTWYTDAVIWAKDAKVVKGISDTAFAPTANITREQIATILYRYAEAEAVTEDALADFADADKVSAWAVEAVNWAVSAGLINGMDETTLAPQGNATRAQIATILMRYCEN